MPRRNKRAGNGGGGFFTKHGFVRVAAAAPYIKPADCRHNGESILNIMRQAAQKNVSLLVLPELCVTGSTCGSLFLQPALWQAAEETLLYLAKVSRDLGLLTWVGAPVRAGGGLYNMAVAICGGEIIGAVPQLYPTGKYFTAPKETRTNGEPGAVQIGGQTVPAGARLLFQHTQNQDFTVAAEIGADAGAPVPPAAGCAAAGATVVAHLSALPETAGFSAKRRAFAQSESARLHIGYIHAGAGPGESTTDHVFSGHCFIAENGELISETDLFTNDWTYTDLDTEWLRNERLRSGVFNCNADGYRRVPFTLPETDVPLLRAIDPAPFIPSEGRARRCEEVLQMQTAGLVQRLRHTGAKTIALAVSGGLDSTLALMVAVRAFRALGLSPPGIQAVSMPGFGTSERTRGNAKALAEAVNASFQEISITTAVTQHFSDINHPTDARDLVYENAQARERTQIIMDLAMKHGGFMLGTGDLSEMALGFTTYNGDHMSMYNVNGGVPKTLIPPLLQAEAENAPPALKTVLLDIIRTPISPELLPPNAEGAAQITENLVGPYALHDFFLYNVLRKGFSPSKILFLAEKAFEGTYESDKIKNILILFYRRFFANQFKRSCQPDGPAVGSVSLSPRAGFDMPSDASAAVWLAQLSDI